MRRKVERQRRRVFVLLTWLLPFAGILLAEGGLRLGGFGHTYPLFVPVRRAAGYVHANPQVIRRFMVNEADAPSLRIRPVPFRLKKTPQTLRLVVQGGSTAEGYPYGYPASPAGMLQQRLQHTFPERRVEVITTATAAVNTYTLLDYSNEILEHRPDAVVIYAGHNEYLGILGVGSTFAVSRYRPLVLTFLWLRDVRLLQLGRRGLAALQVAPEVPSRRTLMERVVDRDRIPYGSPLYRRGLEQYRTNLRALLRRYREAAIPVLIGTLVSNERDRPPFLSSQGPGVDAEAWQRSFEAGRLALESGDPASALVELDGAVRSDDLHAKGHFWRGRALEELGRFSEAREAYIAARDRDELRFRAPREINAILRRVAAEEEAHVVEVEEAFHRRAKNGLVGNDLMLEHLHPNVAGYFVLADAFYEALRVHKLLGPWGTPVPRDVARREIPVTEVDRLFGEYRIGYLTAGWPFTVPEEEYELPPPNNRTERIAQEYYRGSYGWPDAMRRLLDLYRSRRETENAARVAVLVADAFPYQAEDQLAAATLLDQLGRPESTCYRQRAQEVLRDHPEPPP